MSTSVQEIFKDPLRMPMPGQVNAQLPRTARQEASQAARQPASTPTFVLRASTRRFRKSAAAATASVAASVARHFLSSMTLTDYTCWITWRITKANPFVRFASLIAWDSTKWWIISSWCTGKFANSCVDIQRASGLLGQKKI